MDIPTITKEKLRRYLINADPFLWNVLEGKNKKERVHELKTRGFLANYNDKTSMTYGKMNQDLLVEAGIEMILEKIVIPRVKIIFKPDIIDYFRRCWEQGQTPTLNYLKQHGLYRKHHFTNEATYDDGWPVPPIVGHKEPALIFLQIDTQHDFVERWTVFAALWFEEIEPLFDLTKERRA